MHTVVRPTMATARFTGDSSSDSDYDALLHDVKMHIAFEMEHKKNPTPALPQYFRDKAEKHGKRCYPISRQPPRRSEGVAANLDDQGDKLESYWNRRWLSRPLNELDLIKFRRFFGIGKPRFDLIVERALDKMPESSRW